MTLVHYKVEVKPGLMLALPAEAEALNLRPGDKIFVQFDAEQEQTLAPSGATPRVDSNIAGAPGRDPDLVARVRSVRGKYARTEGVLGSEELHRERQFDKIREEIRIEGYQP